MTDLVARLADTSTPGLGKISPCHRVCRWDGGGEVWLLTGAAGTPRDGKIIAASPFISGSSRIVLEVGDVLPFGPDRLTGGLSVRLPSVRPGDHALDIVIELLPFVPDSLPRPPFAATFEVAALASELAVYPSAEAFLARVPASKLMSPGGVAPLAPPTGSAAGGPLAGDICCVALVAGKIEHARRLTNPISGLPYFAMTLATDRGRINLACGADAVSGSAPADGAIAQARARLVARVIEIIPAGARKPSPRRTLGPSASRPPLTAARQKPRPSPPPGDPQAR